MGNLSISELLSVGFKYVLLVLLAISLFYMLTGVMHWKKAGKDSAKVTKAKKQTIIATKYFIVVFVIYCLFLYIVGFFAISPSHMVP